MLRLITVGSILHGLRSALIVWLPIVLLVALLYFM